MNDEITKKLFDKVNEMSTVLATNNANIKSFLDLEHEARIRALENSVATLVESVKSLVRTIEERKDSNQYLITTGISAVAILLSVYSVVKHS